MSKDDERPERGSQERPLRWRVRELNPATAVRRGGRSVPQQTAYVADRILAHGVPADDAAVLGQVLGELQKVAAGQLGEVPTNLQNYIDYQALGRDMELEGNFLVTAHGIFEYLN